MLIEAGKQRKIKKFKNKIGNPFEFVKTDREGLEREIGNLSRRNGFYSILNCG